MTKNTEFEQIFKGHQQMDDRQVIKSTAAVNKIGDTSPYLQIALGAGGGLVTGYILLKTCKMVAVVVGSSILIIELAVQSEIITITWEGLAKYMDDSRQGLESRALPADPFKQLKKSIVNSARFSVAFVGGFLLGMGFS